MAATEAAGLPQTVHASDVKLRVAGITKTFRRRDDQLLVLDNVSFDVRPGEFFAIVGPSGCGKTTFLRIVQGLEAPTSGSILLSGNPLTGPGPDRGFVFQNDSLFPWRTVLRNVTFGNELRGEKRASADRSARSIISLVGLGGFEGHYPHELSGADRIAVFSARPGRLMCTLDVDLPRPRSLQVKRSAKFQGIVDEVWNLIAQSHGSGAVSD